MVKDKVNKNKKAKSKELFKNILILIATIVIFLIILEIAIRIFVPEPIYPMGLKTKDDLLGFKLTPNFTGRDKEPGFDVTIKTNSLGLRNPEIGEKTEKRILVLGDSVVYGYGVENNETFPYIMNDLTDYEVINAGVTAYSTKQELDYLKRDGIKLQPDIVILTFFIGNDFTDNLLRDENSTVKKESSWFTNLKTNIRKYYKTYPFVMDRLKKIYFIRNFLVKTGLASNEESYQYQVYNVNYSEELEQGKIITFNYISQASNFCKENNIKFILLLVPSRYQVYDDAWESLLKYNNFKPEEHSRDKPNQILIEFAVENNIIYIDMLDYLEEQKEQFYLENDVAHFNPQGHIFIAEKLAENIKELQPILNN